jgi:hypothetical protein
VRRAALALFLLVAGCLGSRDDWTVPYDHAALAGLEPGTPRAEVLALLGGVPRGEYALPGGGAALAFGYGEEGDDGAPVAAAEAMLELDPEGRYVGLLYARPEPENAAWSATDLEALIEQHGPLEPVATSRNPAVSACGA